CKRRTDAVRLQLELQGSEDRLPVPGARTPVAPCLLAPARQMGDLVKDVAQAKPTPEREPGRPAMLDPGGKAPIPAHDRVNEMQKANPASLLDPLRAREPHGQLRGQPSFEGHPGGNR